MATIVMRTIRPGGGGDYSSLSAFEAAERGNLVALDRVIVAECYSGDDTTGVEFSSANWTTDATRYIKIIAASGHSWYGGGVWDATKYRLWYNGAYGISVNGPLHVWIEGIQIGNSVAASGANILSANVASGSAAANWIKVYRCYIRQQTDRGIFTSGTTYSKIYVARTIIEKIGSYINIDLNTSGSTASVVIACSTLFADSAAQYWNFNGGFGGILCKIRNVASFKRMASNVNYINVSSVDAWYNGSGIEGTTDTSTPGGAPQHSVAATDFADVAANPPDLRLRSTAALLRDTGTDISAWVDFPDPSILWPDINGTSGALGAWDIGADEYAPAGTKAKNIIF